MPILFIALVFSVFGLAGDAALSLVVFGIGIVGVSFVLGRLRPKPRRTTSDMIPSVCLTLIAFLLISNMIWS